MLPIYSFQKIKYNIYNKHIPSCHLFLTDIKSIQGAFDNIMTVILEIKMYIPYISHGNSLTLSTLCYKM